MKGEVKNNNFCLHDIYGAKKWKHLILETVPTVEKNEITKKLQKYRLKTFQDIEDIRKHWTANSHCSTFFIPQTYPDLELLTKGGTYWYRVHIASCRPDREYFQTVSKVYTHAVSELCMKKPSARNFMLPNFTMGLNWLDPETKRLTINGIAKYLRTQEGLHCVVFEDSKLSIKSFLILLLALANSGKMITKLYLWRALKFKDIPFIGPLPDAKYNNNLRPRPPTVHLNGRQFLKDLKKLENNQIESIKADNSNVFLPQVEITQNSQYEVITHDVDGITDVVNNILHKASISLVSISDEEDLNSWIQDLILQVVQIKSSDVHLLEPKKSQSLYEWNRKLLLELINFERNNKNKTSKNKSYSHKKESTNILSNHTLNLEEKTISNETGVSIEPNFPLNIKSERSKISTGNVPVKRKIEKSGSTENSPLIPEYEKHKSIASQTIYLTNKEVTNVLAQTSQKDFEIDKVIDIEETIRKNKIKACQVYLDFYKHCSVPKHILREIYKISLGSLCSLKTLSVNYSYLADDTGKTLMSIGSILSQTLRYIELLCCAEDLPWKASRREEPGAMHSIPDIAWKKALQHCPKLKVHLVLVSVCTYDEINMFLSKSMPLSSFHLDSGFPQNILGQYNYGSTLKTLTTHFAGTLENIVLVLWRASSYLDVVYLKCLREMKALFSFELSGYIANINTIEKMCDIILEPKCGIMYFKFVLQEDPCQLEISRESVAKITKKYKDRFEDKGVAFYLDTFKK